VAYNIPELLASRKAADAVLVIAVILLGLLSFGLGRLSVESGSSRGVAFCDELPPSTVSAAILNASPDTTLDNAGIVTPSQEASFVGSKNGSVYHFPWCSGAQRIKEENKIWFSSKEDAERAGYRPASNCKGL